MSECEQAYEVGLHTMLPLQWVITMHGISPVMEAGVLDLEPVDWALGDGEGRSAWTLGCWEEVGGSLDVGLFSLTVVVKSSAMALAGAELALFSCNGHKKHGRLEVERFCAMKIITFGHCQVHSDIYIYIYISASSASKHVYSMYNVH